MKMGWIRKNRRRIGFAALFALILGSVLGVIYGRSLWFPFLNWDDPQFVSMNPNLAFTAENLRLYLLHPFADLYTPLPMLSFMLDGQGGPFVCRLNNLLLHFGAGCLLYLIFARLGIRRSLAMLFALVWAVSPQRVESAAWITERKDVLCGFFAFASIYMFQRALSGRSIGASVLSGILAVLAIFAKPAAAALPGVMIVYAVCVNRRGERFPWGVVMISSAAALAANVWSGIITSETIPGSLELNYAVPLHNLFWYPLTAVFPYSLNPIYPEIDGMMEFAPMLLAGIALTAGMAALGYFLRVPPRHMICAALIAGGTLVPVLGMLHYTDFDYCDRYNYLAAAPVLAAAGILLTRLGRKSPKAKRPVVWILVFYTAVLGLRSVMYLPEWSSSQRLFPYALTQSGGRPNVKLAELLTNTAVGSSDRELTALAVEVLESNLSRPAYDRASCRNSLAFLRGHLAFLNGDADGAVREFSALQSRRPGEPIVFFEAIPRYYLNDQAMLSLIRGERAPVVAILRELAAVYRRKKDPVWAERAEQMAARLESMTESEFQTESILRRAEFQMQNRPAGAKGAGQ